MIKISKQRAVVLISGCMFLIAYKMLILSTCDVAPSELVWLRVNCYQVTIAVLHISYQAYA